MRTLVFSFMISAGLALTGSQANAAAINGTAVREAAQPLAPTLVRDGCGRGRHFSRYRGMCVWNGAPLVYGPPVYAPPVYGPPVYGYGYYGPPVVYGPAYGYYRRW